MAFPGGQLCGPSRRRAPCRGLHSVQRVYTHIPSSAFAYPWTFLGNRWSTCIRWGRKLIPLCRSTRGGFRIGSELQTVNGSSRALVLSIFMVLKLVPSPCARLHLRKLAFVSRVFPTSRECNCICFWYVSCLKCLEVGNCLCAPSRRVCSLPDDSVHPNQIMMLLFNSQPLGGPGPFLSCTVHNNQRGGG